MPILTPNKTSITRILSSTAISLCMSIMAISLAHAEQYCKSVDKDGNATYTLAPDKGCNAKKMKTVAINHHITPGSPTSTKTDSTAPATTAPATTTPATTTPTSTAPATTAPATTTPTSKSSTTTKVNPPA